MLLSTSDITIVENQHSLSRKAADMFVKLAADALKTRLLFTMALSGGSTPESLYRLLNSDPGIGNEIDWEKIHFFWGDERHFPPEHPESNFRMAQQTLFAGLPVQHGNIHRIQSEDSDADRAARSYEQEISRFFQPPAGQFPQFDLIWLGMGTDGHIASLFPQSDALSEKKRWVTANWVEKLQSHRITLTLPVINHARCVIILVSGAAKAKTLKQVLENDSQPPIYPAQMIRPLNGKLCWIIDRAAAKYLDLASK